MEFRETLLAAQRNQQQKSSESNYYKARFDPPKKEQKVRDRLSSNIQKFLAKKEEEERQKKLEAQRKREELLAMRDPKALRKIQKTLKVIKSANKSVIEDAVDRNNTALTREGPEQPDQDDYGYESQEAAALYEKMMQKYSKLSDEPKFPIKSHSVSKDLNGTRERVKNALQHEDDPVPHKRRRKGDNTEKELSPPPKYEQEKKTEEKPKIRKIAPPPMDFNQLLKLAEKKKSEPIDVVAKKQVTEPEPDRLMTKKQKREYEEEMARRQRRQERIEAEKNGNRKVSKEDKPLEKEKKSELSGIGRIPKLGEKNSMNHKNDNLKSSEKEKIISDREKAEKIQREKERIRLDRDKAEREKLRLDRERLEKLKAERERIDRDIDRLNKDRDRLEKTKSKLEAKSTSDKINKSVSSTVDRSKMNAREQPAKHEVKKSIDLKSQNTYRIDKMSEKKISIPSKSGDTRHTNGHSQYGKLVPKPNKDLSQKSDVRDKVLQAKQKSVSDSGSLKANGHIRPDGKRLLEGSREMPSKRSEDRKPVSNSKALPGPSKPKVSNSFDFDKHVNSIGKNGGRQFPPGDVRRKPRPDELKKKKRRTVDSESDYDSEMDDFIDDGDENIDYSTHIKEIFGYDKSKYRDMDDDDDPMMESSFARQQREEYISKKIGIMEDLEDMRMEAMEKKKSKKRRISDD